MIDRISSGWLNFVIRRPYWVLATVVIALAASIAGLPKLRLDASSESLTLERDVDLDYFRQMSKQYNSGDFLVVTYTPETPLFGDKSLHTLQQLHDDLAAIPGVSSVNSILNVPLLYSPKRSLREMAKEPRKLSDPDIDKNLAKAEFLESPIYRKMILGPDGQTTALQLNIAVDSRYLDLVTKRDNLRERRKAESLTAEEKAGLDAVSDAFLNYRIAAEKASHTRVEAVRGVVSKYQDGAQIYVGGVTMITADMISFIRKDLVIFGSAALAFMVLVLSVIFKSPRFVLLPLATCVSAVVITLGIVSWANWHLTVISSNFVALLLIIALAIIIHLVVRYREYEAANPEWSQKQVVFAACNYMVKPCLYTALTTIVAFISLVISDIRPVMDFGWMMTIGLIFALILAFALLPAVLVLLPRESMAEVEQSESKKPLTAYCAYVVEKLGSWILLVAVVILGLSIWGISRLQVENRFVDYFHEETEIHRGLTLIDQKLGGTTSLDLVLSPEAATALASFSASNDELAEEDDPFGGGDISDASFAAGDEAFAVGDEEFAAEDEEFSGDVFAEGDDPFAETASDAEDDPFGDLNAFEDTSNEAEQGGSVWMTVTGLQLIEKIADYLDGLPEVGKVQSLATLYKVGKDINGSLNNFELALMERSLTREVSETLVSPYLDAATDQTRINMRIIDTHPGLQRSELVERIRRDIAAMDGVDGEHIRYSGLLVLYNNMLQSLFSSQIVTLGAVFLGIAMMFMLLFRSPVIAIVAIIPNMLAAAAILGVMGIVGIPLDMMTITIAAITVGIGVDDTIHYIHRFKTELAVDGNYMAAMHRAHRSIGRAMYYTSIIIIFGFSIMVLSQFIPTIYFGVLTGFAMLAALSGALFILPQLILLTKPFKVE